MGELYSGRRLEDYVKVVGFDVIEGIIGLASMIKGAKVVHVNATAYGGGVAEMLKSLIPLLRSAGLNAKWEVIRGDLEFFKVTKSIHNALQGDRRVVLSEEARRLYLEVNRRNAEELDLNGDVVVVHDPQPLPLVGYRGGEDWVWRCHIDLSDPSPHVWELISGFLDGYDALVFSLERYVPGDLASRRVYVVPPAIDPLSEKNRPLSPSEVLKVLERYDVDPDRPIIGQVSRFDPWKDPLGVIDVYRKVKERVPSVQLLMIGSFAHDDPEGVEWYEKTVSYAGNDRDIHVLTNMEGVGDYEVNAFQRSMSVALQLSIREGFGLAVTEALWKGVPVVARRAGGIPLQVLDGVTGYLIDTLEEAVERVLLLLRRPWLARELGRNGAEHVKENFLITRLLRDHLRIYVDLLEGRQYTG